MINKVVCSIDDNTYEAEHAKKNFVKFVSLILIYLAWTHAGSNMDRSWWIGFTFGLIGVIALALRDRILEKTEHRLIMMDHFREIHKAGGAIIYSIRRVTKEELNKARDIFYEQEAKP